jgi:hypothetical protein
MVATLPGLRVGLNCTLELDDPAAAGEELKTRIEDMQGDELVVAWPSMRGQNAQVSIGDLVYLTVPTPATGAILYLDGEIATRSTGGGGALPTLSVRVLAVGRRENRQHYRLRVSLQPTDCAVWHREFGRTEAEGYWRPIDAIITDISGGGIGLLSEGQVPEGARMRIRMPYPASIGELVADARVAKCIPSAATTSTRYMVGTQFEQLDHVQRERLLRCIHRYQVEQRRRENARVAVAR